MWKLCLSSTQTSLCFSHLMNSCLGCCRRSWQVLKCTNAVIAFCMPSAWLPHVRDQGRRENLSFSGGGGLGSLGGTVGPNCSSSRSPSPGPLLCLLFILASQETLQRKWSCSSVTRGPCLVLSFVSQHHLLSEAIHVGVCSSRNDGPTGSVHSPGSLLACHVALDKERNCSMQKGGGNRSI